MNTTRRTFLRLTGAAAGALVIAKYAEPLAVLADHGPWVEDKGDFYIVRVPDFKTFANEHLEKPTIFLLGESATVCGAWTLMVSPTFSHPRAGYSRRAVSTRPGWLPRGRGRR
jgi:hypothetical protein